MISVNEVTMNFGARMLFDGVTVTFNAGERYGLTGPNGSGRLPLGAVSLRGSVTSPSWHSMESPAPTHTSKCRPVRGGRTTIGDS